MIDEILKNIPENIDAGIFVLNHEGTVVYVNNTAVQLMGRSKSYIMNHNTSRAYEDGLIDTHIFQLVLKTKKPVTRFEAFRRAGSGYTRPLLITQTPVLDYNSEVKYSVGIIRDMEYLEHKAEAARKEKMGNFPISAAKAVVASNFIYAGEAMRSLIQKVDQVAESSATILIQGESGTGKEVMAQYIHNQSLRRDEELVAINCAALPENLLEAELFGYEKGAFTGALKEGKPGLVELADQGTLFLDEIDSLPMSLQGKLLRTLESREVRRIGSVKSTKVDFRLLAATNADLHNLIKEKHFRVDLFYRINVVPIVIPPLRERKEDIRLLCEAFLSQYERKYDRYKTFSQNAYETIMRYDWPGNVRELKNFVERIVLLTDVTITEIDNISPDLLSDSGDALEMPFFVQEQVAAQNGESKGIEQFQAAYEGIGLLKDKVHEYECWMIEQAIKTHGSYSKAARALGIDKSTLIRKIKYR